MMDYIYGTDFTVVSEKIPDKLTAELIDTIQSQFLHTHPDMQINRFIVNVENRFGPRVRILAQNPGLTGMGMNYFYDFNAQLIEAERANNFYREVNSVWISLHEGDFAGYTGKMLYFLLGLLAVMAMILGNYIWIFKHNQKPENKVTRFKVATVHGFTSGVFLALASCFLMARFAGSIGLEKANYEILFLSLIAIKIGVTFSIKNHHIIIQLCYLICCITFIALPISDAIRILFSHHSILNTDWLLISCILLILAGLSWLLSVLHAKLKNKYVTRVNQQTKEVS
ncbi:PepSY-associated TM helix domain-containing protein [Pseudoalteromonas neustonica]|uniref:PepSY-associated TM helix domain-containing protein n=1 Tax=Pseudoalteromonas neustonica TaxID=1840331 RepID=A0ABU9U0S3_9GAMM